jgi:hypothetical protein
MIQVRAHRRSFSRRAVWFFGLLLALFSLPSLMHAQDTQRRGRKYTPPPTTCKITVTVVKATTGKPLENAAVIFHPLKDGKGDGNMEMKTNGDGKAILDIVPVGDTVRLQVIVNGYQTFGDDYPVDTDTKEILVKMKRPSRQYSIYEKHDDTVQGAADDKPQQDSQPQPKPQ